MSAPVILPKGHGLRPLSIAELRASSGPIFDALVVWEKPRTRGHRRYVVSADVADGLGQDRSVVEVVRMGTIEEPAEQVAEYVSDRVQPMQLSYVLHTVGQWYRDMDGVEAMVAIECNNHGLSTQDTLQLHLGYTHFYRWEYYDAADPADRFSTKIGWLTTSRTRPLLLDKLYTALTTRDPITSQPDLVTHSPILHAELKDFQTEGALWEAAAARGAHDDTVMALAIANYVAWKLQAGETEPLDERRRRRSEQQAILADVAHQDQAGRPDWRNSPATTSESGQYDGETLEQIDEALFDLTYDPRSVDY